MKLNKNGIARTISLILCAALILIPLPTMAFKVLFFADFLFAVSILVAGIISALQKSVAKIMAKQIFYFSLFTLALNITWTRNIFLFVKSEIETIPVTMKFAAGLFEEGFLPGILLAFVLIALSLFTAFYKPKTANKEFSASIKFFRGSEIAQAILYGLYTLVVCFVAHVTNSVTFSGATILYFPIATAHMTLFFFVPLLIAGVGINFLRWIEEKQN